ncbi:uncharacterized protein LOC143296573 [Babylonia areolata]|uniref:uncharacterized protein LOC143296573 n=1 Tax=Babylonia areolata TaxID=304850 RepID=UPI003FD1B61A
MSKHDMSVDVGVGGEDEGGVGGSEGVVIPVKYLGCMIDHGANDTAADSGKRGSFVTEAKDISQVSINSCVYKCFALRFKMAAMQKGKLCFCGSHTRGLDDRRDEFCNEPCAGNCRQRCGGLVTLSVYETGYQKEPRLTFDDWILKKGFVGCFRKKALGNVCTKQKKKPNLKTPRMTPHLCALYCHSGRKYEQMPISALMTTEMCCCGKLRDKARDAPYRVDDRRCMIQCAGAAKKAQWDKTQCVGKVEIDGVWEKTFTAWDALRMVEEGSPSEPRSVFSSKAGWIAPRFRSISSMWWKRRK